MLALSLVIALLLALSTCQAVPMVARDAYPQIISHRGASGYIPEHSLQAYQTAINLLTDYIEPDLCLSKDGVFVAMHDLLLDETTDVAEIPAFANRKTTRLVDGKNMTGFFVNDFLLSELQQLRLKQRLTFRTPIFDGYFTIPTFTDIMSLAQQNYQSTGRLVGIYPELKHPSYFKALGFPMEDLFLDALVTGGYEVKGENVPNDLKQVVPVVFQCFEEESLKYVKEKSSLPRIYLTEKKGYKFWQNKDNLLKIAEFATGVGPEKSDLGSPAFATGKAIMDSLHALGLRAHPWTFRADNGILSKFKGDFELENMYFYCCLGLDGLFTEFPDRSRETIDLMKNYTMWKAPSAPQCTIDCSAY